MYELTGDIKEFAIDYKTNKAEITFSINEKTSLLQLYDELHTAKKLSLKVGKYRENRSLNANAYAWKLLSEIADVLRSNKEDVYVEMLKRYGQSEVISMLSHIPIKGYFKYYDEIGQSTLNGKDFTHYRIHKGSSEFNTKEMAIFIDGIVSEAKELGISTETPERIAELKSLWEAE